MLHVILLILKILGIIVLVVTGLILLMVYAVFFSAIPYRVEARKREEAQVSVFASWMFRILTIRMKLDGGQGWEPVFQMRLFGYPLWQNVEEDARWKRMKRFRSWLKKRFVSRWRHDSGGSGVPKRAGAKAPREEEQARPVKETADSLEERQQECRPEETAELLTEERRETAQESWSEGKPESLTEKQQERMEESRSEGKTEAVQENRPQGTLESLTEEALEERSKDLTEANAATASEKAAKSSLGDERKTIFQKAGYAFFRVCDKIKQIWRKLTGPDNLFRKLGKRKDAILDLWNREEHRRAREALLGEVRYLWKKLRPKKVRGKITFGFADPAETGICMGVAGMLCAWYPKKLEIVPDFDREILEGEILLKGKARIYVFVCVLWRIYRNEDIRHMYRHWRE